MSREEGRYREERKRDTGRECNKKDRFREERKKGTKRKGERQRGEMLREGEKEKERKKDCVV